MSSKENHINITRENYEEYFLLYIDNELGTAEKAAVETFVLLHPDLAEELELLQGTKLELDTVSFDGKEALLSESLKMESVDESLLLYIDDELDPREKMRVKFEIEHNASLRKQYKQLKSVKLDPKEKIICTFKNELYRNQESKRPVYWLRIAAAVILLAGAGTLMIVGNNDKTLPVAQTEIKKLPAKDNKVVIPVEVSPQEQIIATDDPPETRTKQNEPLQDQPVNVLPQNDIPQDQIAYTPVDVTTTNTDVTSTGAENIQRTTAIDFQRAQQIINSDPVTNAVIPASNFIAAPAPDLEAGDDNSDGKQGSVRGLLRKATRFIERRTGINPVNDDDKLLVGMVAISLK